MTDSEPHSYRFNSFLLDVTERQLLSRGKAISLTPKAFDVLVYLIEHSGHLVLKEDLMRAVWPDSFVEEVNLPRTIHTIRATLGEDRNGNKFIETVPTKGYRFVAKVEKVSKTAASLPPAVQPVLTAEGRPKSEADQSDALRIERKGSTPASASSWPRRRWLLITLAIVSILSGSWAGLKLTDQSVPAKQGLQTLAMQTANGEAYQLYQQGKLLIERGNGSDTQDALMYFDRAIELDRNYAAAYVGKADAKIRMFWGSARHDDIGQARAAINKAIELDGSNSYARTLSCRIKGTYDWDFDGAEKECWRAIELDPNDHEAHRELALFLVASGREEEALRQIETAIALAPTSFNKRSRGQILYYSRRYDEAIEQLRQVVQTDSNQQDARKWLMYAYEMANDYEHALECRIGQLEHEKTSPAQIEEVKKAYAEKGWPGVLQGIVISERPTMATATAYAQSGDKEKAFEALESILERRGILLVQLGREPRLDPLRGDPRFDLLLKRVGLN